MFVWKVLPDWGSTSSSILATKPLTGAASRTAHKCPTGDHTAATRNFFFLDPSQDVILFERRTYSPFLCGEAERSTPQKGDKTQLIKMNHLWNLSFCVISKDEDKSAKRNDTAHPSSTQGVCLGERFGRERRAPQKSMLLPFGPVIVLLGIRCRGIILNIEKASCTRLICYFIFKNYSIMYINKTWKQPIYPTIEEEKVNYIVWLLCGY